MSKVLKKIKSIIKIILMDLNNFRYNLNQKKISSKKYGYCNFDFNSNISIKNISCININNDFKGKFVGAVNYKNIMYCIPNKLHCFLKVNLDNDDFRFINFEYDDIDQFLWSGGCVYKEKIYGFPRYSNDLICLDTKDDHISVINLKINYKREHHYSGVCLENGLVYQPPRGSNTILVIDLNNYKTRKIKIAPNFLKYDYSTGVIAPNGKIYFFPVNVGRVMVLDPSNDKISFIGHNIMCSTFGPCIGSDNNIYGFSSYGKGILKIDILKNSVLMIHKEIGCPGCYGNKLGINGKIYGIPGNGSFIWEYNPFDDTCKKIYNLDKQFAKCAGGVVACDGSIYTAPAFGSKIYKIEFDKKIKLTEEQLNSIYFSDNY